MIPSFKSLSDLLKAFPNEEACIMHLEVLRWNGTPVSPFDATSKVYKCSEYRYKCKNTNKYFNVKVGTIFEESKIPLQKWFMALYILSSRRNGVSSHQLARDIDVTQKSAWFLLQRLHHAFEQSGFQATLSDAAKEYYGSIQKHKYELAPTNHDSVVKVKNSLQA